MALQILNDPNATLAGQYTSSVGQGLSGLLNQLAINKAQQLQGSKLSSLLGLPNQQAQNIAGLTPELQQLFVKQKLQEPQNIAYAQMLNSILGGGQIEGTAAPSIAGEQTAPTEKRQLSAAIPPQINTQQLHQLAEFQLKKEKATAAERAAAFKATQDIRRDITTRARSAKSVLNDLDRLEELEKEGKLDTPGYTEFLKRSGFDIPALMNPGSEEFNKITQNFTRDAKNYYGGRITNNELEQFLRTIPSLSQSPEGRKRVIANLKYINRGALEYFNSLQEIMSENKGIPPLDLDEKIESRIDKKLNKLATKFKDDLAKPVPKGQNKFVTAIQAGAGNLVANLPKAATNAALGTAAGARLGGPIGALAGGTIGGLSGLSGYGIKDLL